MEHQEKTVSIYHTRSEYAYPNMNIEFLSTFPLKVRNCDDEKLKKVMSDAFIKANPTWKIVKVTVE